jgi:NTE family protein
MKAKPKLRHTSEVGIVLSGGGARGAYEAGALSILLPVLEQRGELPGTILGTSIGSLNGAHLAATAHLSATDSAERLVRLWRQAQFSDIIGPLVSPRELGRLLAYIGAALGFPGSGAAGLFDTSPMPRTLHRLVDWRQLHRNIEDAILTLAVVATSYATGDSVVFHEASDSRAIARDRRRGIVYVPARIEVEHLQASASIPVAFPATAVTKPEGCDGWYGDGGTRLNTPLKPALALGAKRVVVIGLNSATPPVRPERHRPDVFDGAAQYMQALFADPLSQDVMTLAGANLRAQAESEAEPDARLTGRREIPYVFIAPQDRLAIGRLAADTFRAHLSGPTALLRAPDLVTLGKLIGAGHGAAPGELFSLLFFATEFHNALIELGRRDAERWLELTHDDGPWRVGLPPSPDLPSAETRNPRASKARRRTPAPEETSVRAGSATTPSAA